VSWLHRPGGYHLLCNRDEKRTRAAAAAPRELQCNGVRYIAPIDPDRGGTWIAVNEYGLGLCLLNGPAGPTGARSRGLIIPDLVWAGSIDDCALLLRNTDVTTVAPFTLLMLGADGQAIIARWDGSTLDVNAAADSEMPLTSSSFDAEGVRRIRLQQFARHTGGGARLEPSDLYRFHSSHGPSPDAYSPCMHREDAETVSCSWAVVSPREIRFLYLPVAPCRWSPGDQQILARAA